MNSAAEVIELNEAQAQMSEEELFRKQLLAQIPQEDLEAVASMNRAQRRAWLRQFKRRGKGYTR